MGKFEKSNSFYLLQPVSRIVTSPSGKVMLYVRGSPSINHKDFSFYFMATSRSLQSNDEAQSINSNVNKTCWAKIHDWQIFPSQVQYSRPVMQWRSFILTKQAHWESRCTDKLKVRTQNNTRKQHQKIYIYIYHIFKQYVSLLQEKGIWGWGLTCCKPQVHCRLQKSNRWNYTEEELPLCSIRDNPPVPEPWFLMWP